MFKATIHNFKDEEQWNDVKHVLEEIKIKDLTLNYSVNIYNLEIFVFDEDKNRLHKRCTWIIHRLDVYSRLIYEVIEV